MGLDMYLFAEQFLGKYDKPDLADKVRALFPEIWKTNIETVEVKFQVGYWRKANAVHKWFVDNCQKGIDDCREHDVDRKKLVELKKLCETALASKSPQDVLPIQRGFFFGSDEYREWYKSGLENTIEIIDKVLKLPDDYSIYYRSSW